MDEKEVSEMQEEMMTVLVVEPMKAPYVKNIPNELEDLQQAVGGDIEMTYPFDDKVGILLNGNGKFEGLPLNRALYDDRGQVYDPIHFKKHIQISMEHGHANHLSDDWSCTAYWYQAAPVTSVTIQPVEERIPLKRTFDIPKPAHQVELTPEMQEAYRSRNERMEKFKVEKAEQIRLNAARTAPSETGNKELAHKVKKEFDKEK